MSVCNPSSERRKTRDSQSLLDSQTSSRKEGYNQAGQTASYAQSSWSLVARMYHFDLFVLESSPLSHWNSFLIVSHFHFYIDIILTNIECLTVLLSFQSRRPGSTTSKKRHRRWWQPGLTGMWWVPPESGLVHRPFCFVRRRGNKGADMEGIGKNGCKNYIFSSQCPGRPLNFPLTTFPSLLVFS